MVPIASLAQLFSTDMDMTRRRQARAPLEADAFVTYQFVFGQGLLFETFSA